jgi:hypothetical protein
MHTKFSTLVALLVLTVSGSATEIKATTKISVTARGASLPIEITDQEILRLSHVFAGAFIGAAAAAPEPSLPRYTLAFDIQTAQGVKESAYVVEYCVDATTGEAFIYLPGRGEASYRRNVSTILRTGQDGTWRRASSEWSAALQQYLR